MDLSGRRGDPSPVAHSQKVLQMNVSSWLWNWLDAPSSQPPSLDAFDHAAKLSLRKLEDRQVLSVTSIFAAGLLDIDVDAGDSVVISVDTTDASHEVLVNGAYVDIDNDNSNGIQALLANQVTSIDIDATGAFDNSINLAGVTVAEFTSLSGSITVDAGDGADGIVGSEFIDTLSGGLGADTLDGGLGNDILDGGGGDDIYQFTGIFGSDTVSDALGHDLLDLSSVTTNLSANLSSGLIGDGANSVAFSVAQIEFITSGSGNDTFEGLDAVSTWTVGSTHTYSSGSVTISFSGFETLHGGSAADSFFVDFDSGHAADAPSQIDAGSGDDVISISSAIYDADVDAVEFSAETITLDGELSVHGGSIHLTATHEIVIESSGAIHNDGGLVVVDAGVDGTAWVSGTIDVADADAGETGGTVHVLGQRVALLDGAVIDASGHSGGGTILFGGDFQGRNSAIHNARQTFVGDDAALRADALTRGDGGKVIVWADHSTQFAGSLSAHGATGGRGGFAEISGHDWLAMTGSVDLAGPAGGGTILFDPKNITIANGGADSISANDIFSENPASDVTFDADLITAITNTGAAVILQANNDITISEAIITNNAGGTGGAITLQAGRSILINANVTTDDGAFTVVSNDPAADGSNRDAGTAVISIGAVTINTGIGAMSFIGDDMAINAAATLTTTGVVSIVQQTSGRAIDLGTETAGSLSLTDAELDRITAGDAPHWQCVERCHHDFASSHDWHRSNSVTAIGRRGHRKCRGGHCCDWRQFGRSRGRQYLAESGEFADQLRRDDDIGNDFLSGKFRRWCDHDHDGRWRDRTLHQQRSDLCFDNRWQCHCCQYSSRQRHQCRDIDDQPHCRTDRRNASHSDAEQQFRHQCFGGDHTRR